MMLSGDEIDASEPIEVASIDSKCMATCANGQCAKARYCLGPILPPEV